MSLRQSAEVRPVVLNLLRQAIIHFKNAEGQHAEAFYRAALAADLTPLSQIEYATFLSTQGQKARAITLLLDSWEFSKSMKSASLRALVCHNLAAIYRETGQSERAIQFQQLSISAEMELLENGEITKVSEEARIGQALDDLSQNQTTLAEESLLSLAHSSADLETRTVCHLNLAKISTKNRQTVQALQHMQSAFSLAKRGQNAPLLLCALEQLIELFLKCGHWYQAKTCLDQACQIADGLEACESSQLLIAKRIRLMHALGFLKADPLLN